LRAARVTLPVPAPSGIRQRDAHRRRYRSLPLASAKFAPEDLLYARFDNPALQTLNEQLAGADGLIIATPVYKASFSGALKTLLDLLPERALEGKIVLPLATGGNHAHMLAVDYASKPVLNALKAQEILHGVFADDSQVTDLSA
jgi:FMN reductase